MKFILDIVHKKFLSVLEQKNKKYENEEIYLYKNEILRL